MPGTLLDTWTIMAKKAIKDNSFEETCIRTLSLTFTNLVTLGRLFTYFRLSFLFGKMGLIIAILRVIMKVK